MTRDKHWEPTAPTPPTFANIEPQTPAPRSARMPAHDYPDDQVEHPDEGGGPPIDVRTIKEQVTERLAEVRQALAEARSERDLINANAKKAQDALAADTAAARKLVNGHVKTLLAEEAELSRVANSFKPRAPRKPKTT